ncbi:DUF2569 family protein [Syntrophorhabdus aromaticivorans]|uniref:DUF2569 domain-containing protein n=1 Tax=Syntrophorhabdus aromaticivorans TaxID=328301 RepID=A0A351U1S1_9BACT|nr:DUF2569 family protein [Syntrophorhabdus aromaticivorans]NLW35709.1 DUF2569 domain-containing protein [Syntrophorhabdus aromaticivorans]HBA53902.1 DUF2569 domain-containing protein [Syntrophorhabdus aromaticivorans]
MTAFNTADPQYQGVQGWLLLLCINLTILDPLAALLNLVVTTSATKPFFEQQPAFLRLLLINGTCSIGLAVFSVYAGISLWKVLPRAVTIARKYLSVAFLYAVVSLFLPAMTGLPENVRKEIAGAGLLNSVVTVAYLAVWYQYLKRSRRVAATYTDSSSV